MHASKASQLLVLASLTLHLISLQLKWKISDDASQNSFISDKERESVFEISIAYDP
jgi:hypothetical protein